MTAPTIAHITRVVANHYDLPVSALLGPSKLRRFARPRQIAMHLARALTPCTFAVIGRSIGGRDHSTVCHAVDAIDRLCVADEGIANDLADLAERCAGFDTPNARRSA